MQFCERHWQALKQRIDDRCLSHLISKDGATGEKAPANTFDPLMNAYWAICTNAMMLVDKMTPPGQSVAPYLLSPAPEDPVDVKVYGEDKAGRTWPKCPLCYLNQVHEFTCRETNCQLERVNGYDRFLDLAADEQLERARTLGLVGKPS